MRHTLLPPQERKNLRREYYTRLAIVVCCMISTVFAAGLMSLLPAYMRARAEEQRQLEAVTELRHTNNEKNDSMVASELSFYSSALSILGNSLLRERPSEAIERIVGLSDKEVRLSSLSYFVSGTTTAEVIIQGIAPNRASLLSFKSRLESLTPLARIDLPLSELAKSSSIPFSLKVIYKIP